MEQDKDKRRFTRIPVQFVSVEVTSGPDQPGDPELCFVTNLSENGMLFRSERAYQARQAVTLTFTIRAPETEGVMIRTEALIVHRQDLETSRFYGTQFKGLGIAEHKCLRDYVKSALKSQVAE